MKLTLEEKIEKAKAFGIKFILMNPNEKFYNSRGFVRFLNSTTDAEFIKILDDEIAYFENKQYLIYLNRLGIKYEY